ncbi:MAG: 2-succinyl-5-enolpyruvyl-6-hydroxy-3-cyclohexene-1-carboxylic-acid synthase [Bacteroidota bacterium]
MISQTVFDTSEILRMGGLRQVVISPGSRNAPLTVSFARNPRLESFSVVDERSAAFIALGMSLQSGLPTVACCTSGTALLNFGPAAAEAYYQEIPLLLISADRPPEWINQRDGQTIQQPGALEPHVKASYQLPVDLSHTDAEWEYRRKLKEAIALAQSYPRGPVHINIPFREPFYPDDQQTLQFSTFVSFDHVEPSLQASDNKLASFLQRYAIAKKKIIVLGQCKLTQKEKTLLSQLSTLGKVPIVADIMSSGYDIGHVVTGQDLFLWDKTGWAGLRPDLVVTIGQSLISKQLKLFLRAGIEHWHLSQGERTSDTFQSLRGSVEAPLESVLERLPMVENAEQQTLQEGWFNAQKKAETLLEQGLSQQPFSDFVAMYRILQAVPAGSEVHLANSMAVRYANFFQHLMAGDLQFQANRGTSGIDGSNSTAVGFALNSEKQNVLLTGDVSFLYDRNAFLHEHRPKNLKVIVLNNFGGGIFDLIPGPRRLKDRERTSFLGTRHQRSMKSFATEEGLSYYLAKETQGLIRELSALFDDQGPGLLEIQTEADTNQQVYDEMKRLFQNADQ